MCVPVCVCACMCVCVLVSNMGVVFHMCVLVSNMGVLVSDMCVCVCMCVHLCQVCVCVCVCVCECVCVPLWGVCNCMCELGRWYAHIFTTTHLLYTYVHVYTCKYPHTHWSCSIMWWCPDLTHMHPHVLASITLYCVCLSPKDGSRSGFVWDYQRWSLQLLCK